MILTLLVFQFFCGKTNNEVQDYVRNSLEVSYKCKICSVKSVKGEH